MNDAALIINIGIALITAVAVCVWIKDMKVHKEDLKVEMKVGGPMKAVKASVIAMVTLFFDYIGIGCYAPMTATWKIFKVTRDKFIPGTLQIACLMATCIESIACITLIEVETWTLVVTIVTAALGSFIGGGIVAKLPLKPIRVGIGIALLIVAVVLILKLAGYLSIPAEGIGVSGWKLAVLGIVSFFLGALMTIGVGYYAPTMAIAALLGLNASVAWPLFLGGCAYLIPVAAIRFLMASIKDNESVYDRKVAIYTNTVGLIGPIIAIYFVISMDLFYLNCLVICVITYVGATMLYQGIKNKNDAVADSEEEEKKTIEA